MLLKEVLDLPVKFVASVRVVLSTVSITARTVVHADSRQAAVTILTRIYGAGNVLWVRELASESLSAVQIQRGHLNNGDRILDTRQPSKSACVQASCVAETQTKTRVLSPAELQVKSMADKAQQYKEQAKALRARQQLAKAQAKLLAAQRSSRI